MVKAYNTLNYLFMRMLFMLRSSESVLAETNEPGSELPEFKLINTGFAPGLERSDALPEGYKRSGGFERRDLHLFWEQLNEEWFIRSLVTDTLQLFDRSSKPITMVEIPHPDLRAMTKANSDDAILATLTTSSISEWKIDAANKSLTLVREMKFSPTLRDSKSLKKSIRELKLEAVLDRDYQHKGNVFTTFKKMPGNNPHRYIASSEKRIPHTWDGPQWRDFEPVCESEDDKRRLINAKLYLFDLQNNKSLVVDFPRNATGFTFIEPDVIAFNDLYGNGFWLCDIHFDAITGPSIKPHTQQQTMVSMTSCLLVGKEYWLNIRNDNQPWYTLPKLSEAALKAAAEAKKIHDERFRAGGRKIPKEKSLGDAEQALTKSFLEKESDPDSERLIALAREFAGQEIEDEILHDRGGRDMGFAMHQVKLIEGQYTMQHMSCPETRSLFYAHFAIDNNVYDTINGSEKCDLFHFLSHPKGIYEDEINMFVPSMNLMIRYPMSRAFSDCEVIASPDCYQFTAIFERKKVMQSFRLPNPKLISTLETAFAEIDSKLVSPMPKGVLDIMRRYVQKEPENFRGLFQVHGVFSRKPKLQKNSFSLHFLDLLESAYLYINSGIEEAWRYLNFRRSAPVALDNAEFKAFLDAARNYRLDTERDELFKKAFYLYAGLIYVINQCKLSVNTDIEAIINQAMKVLSNPETRFRNCLELHTSPDTQCEFRALVNDGRNPEILSVVESMLRSTVQTAVKLASQVGKEAEEDFASSMVMSAKRT